MVPPAPVLVVTPSSPAKRKSKKASKAERGPCAHWTDQDIRELVDFLLEHRAEGGDGASFKKSTWQAAAQALSKKPPAKGALKTAGACQSKWTKVWVTIQQRTHI